MNQIIATTSALEAMRMIKDGQKCIICNVMVKNGEIKHSPNCADYIKGRKNR